MILASPTLSESFATKDILLSQTWLQGNSFSEQRNYILKTKLRNFSVVTFIRQRKNCVNCISRECNSSEVIDPGIPYQVWVKGEGGGSTRAEQKLWFHKSSDVQNILNSQTWGKSCKSTVHPIWAINVTLFWSDMYYHVLEVYYRYRRVQSAAVAVISPIQQWHHKR